MSINNYGKIGGQKMSFYREELDDMSLCEDEFNHAKDHLIGLVKEVYKTGSMESFERHLEEVLCVFGLDIPKENPILVKRMTVQEAQLDRSLKAWVGYSRAYAEIMSGRSSQRQRSI